ncbi:Uncharacterised protein [Bacteroides eggerthii]|uniref:Uncharacterized protein n=1 Tax=Bacteroides eggerthii TaxID=28111 RepID=A0A380ZLN1_9BACE|nr:hypothetical protein [Bacteroides eggerthii]SUV47244.1 Uncharacterised protein [Bacteroides eggerthii]
MKKYIGIIVISNSLIRVYWHVTMKQNQVELPLKKWQALGL